MRRQGGRGHRQCVVTMRRQRQREMSYPSLRVPCIYIYIYINFESDCAVDFLKGPVIRQSFAGSLRVFVCPCLHAALVDDSDEEEAKEDHEDEDDGGGG